MDLGSLRGAISFDDWQPGGETYPRCDRQNDGRLAEAADMRLAIIAAEGDFDLQNARADLRVAVVGLGPIGIRVVEALDRGIDGMVLAAVSVQNPEKHRNRLAGLTTPPAILPIEELSDVADLVICLLYTS